MKMQFVTMLLVMGLVCPVITHANQEAQNLGVCLTDSLTGKERKKLAKWIYFGLSTHSTIKPYSTVSQSDIEESDKYVGALITRLLTEDCPDQAKSAYEKGGAGAFEYAFGIVGQVAMQEIMAESNVSNALQSFETYLDQEKFNQVFK